MLTLCIDTSYRYLTCALIRDDAVISSISRECFKRQSEEIFNALEEIFNTASVSKKDIDAICVTKGPGSYTGVRIAMTIAKVMGEVLPCKVYTISTLRLYAANRRNCMVIMDARAGRAYCGIYNNNQVLLDDCIRQLDEIDVKDCQLMGDGSLLGREDYYGDIADAFLKTRHLWERVDDIAHLTPEYLKESESYYR